MCLFFKLFSDRQILRIGQKTTSRIWLKFSSNFFSIIRHCQDSLRKESNELKNEKRRRKRDEDRQRKNNWKRHHVIVSDLLYTQMRALKIDKYVRNIRNNHASIFFVSFSLWNQKIEFCIRSCLVAVQWSHEWKTHSIWSKHFHVDQK